MLRKFSLLAVVAAFTVLGVAAVAIAAGYVFKDGNGNPAKAGKFGEDFILSGPATLSGPSGSGFTNTCTADLTGHVTTNGAGSALKAAITGQVFSGSQNTGCAAPSYAAGTWTLTVKQGQGAGDKSGTVAGVDVLLDATAIIGGKCEYKEPAGGTPTVTVSFHNGSPSTATLGGSINLLPAGTGSGTTSSFCPASGNLAGTLTVVHTTNGNNLTVG